MVSYPLFFFFFFAGLGKWFVVGYCCGSGEGGRGVEGCNGGGGVFHEGQNHLGFVYR